MGKDKSHSITYFILLTVPQWCYKFCDIFLQTTMGGKAYK